MADVDAGTVSGPTESDVGRAAPNPGVHAYDLKAAFYAWVRYEASLISVDMMKYLSELGLIVRPGTEFGSGREKHLHFTFAPSAAVTPKGWETSGQRCASCWRADQPPRRLVIRDDLMLCFLDLTGLTNSIGWEAFVITWRTSLAILGRAPRPAGSSP